MNEGGVIGCGNRGGVRGSECLDVTVEREVHGVEAETVEPWQVKGHWKYWMRLEGEVVWKRFGRWAEYFLKDAEGGTMTK